MNLVSVYRVFSTRSHCVFERALDDMSVSAIENSDGTHIQWMLETPTIFTKEAVTSLVRELCELPYNKSLEELILILEAYPASTHCGPVPEIGILVSINGDFRIGKSEKQRNWTYDECFIVKRKNVREQWNVKDLSGMRKRRDLPMVTG